MLLMGRNQEGQLMVLMFTNKSVIAAGPQGGGWKCVWDRNDLMDLYGLPENLPFYRVAEFMRRVWRVHVEVLKA